MDKFIRRRHRNRSFDINEGNLHSNSTLGHFEEPKEWTIISALDRILDQAEGSELSAKFWETVKSPIAFLSDKLGLSNMQIVFLAMLVESEEPMTWRDFGKYLNCSRVSILIHFEELESLIEKRWVCRKSSWHIGERYEAFTPTSGVVSALSRNKVFVPEKIDGLELQEFVNKLESHINRNLNKHNVSFEDDEVWMLQLCKANTHLQLCQEILRYNEDIHIQSLLLMILFDYAQWADSEHEGLSMESIDRLYPDDYDANDMRQHLINGTHPLINAGYIEHKCVDGIADTERYTLTRRSKEELLSGYIPSRSKCTTPKNKIRDVKSHSIIKPKNMFYNNTEQEQIERLTNLLKQENLSGIQERLASEGMRKGFASLFFGAPGTGKTETVLQIARQTGRDIMQIDIAGMRDKYVGESEKNIKAVFARYREICKNSEVMPILFFNEADAIFGKRTTIGGNNPSVEKMDNAMQNIILQEMEELDGILIATTNLTCNLDTAFERRFLFKVEFKKPNDEVKAKLWCSMLGDCITEEEAHTLASRYDFSGGQIENIARKRTIEFILSGKQVDFNGIDGFCQHEVLNKKNVRNPIGF